MECDRCGSNGATCCCAQCKNVFYCNERCARSHWTNVHANECMNVAHDFENDQWECDNVQSNVDVVLDIGALNLPNQPPAKDTSFRKRGFYKASVTKMKNLFRRDLFTWICIMSYKTSPIINHILFQVKGDLTKLDQRFNGVIEEKPGVAAAVDKGEDPYSIFGTFFKTMLDQAIELGRPLRNPKTNQSISTEPQLYAAFPSLRKLLTMRDKAAFVRLYARVLQNAIFSIPKLTTKLSAWRGYRPLDIPDSMAMDIRNMSVGQEITNWAFMSVSLDSRVSTLFMDQVKQCCMVSILIPASMHAFLISGDSGDDDYPKDITPWHQMEILLPVGCVFRLLDHYPYVTQYETVNRGKNVNSHTATIMLTRIRKIKTK